MAIYRKEAEDRRDEPCVQEKSETPDLQNVGRTYCVMAPTVPLSYSQMQVKEREEPAGHYVRSRTRGPKARPLLRLAVVLLLTVVTVTMPLWLTTDGMLPVMKRLSTSALPSMLPAQNVEISPTSGDDAVSTQSTAVSTTAMAVTTSTQTTAASAPPEGMLPVTEKKLGGSGTKVGDIYVKNSTGYKPDFNALLDAEAECKIKLNAGYQVLIVHTHTTECYAQREDGLYDPDYSPRTTDSSQSVVAVGNVLAQKLEAAGIRTLHATETHDHPQYNGSYDRALDTIEKYLREHPSIEMVLDVHRDAITYDDGSKLKPTAEINGRKAAQVMIITGCDAQGRLYFPGWERNLTMALQIQQSAQKKHQGLMRPLNFAPYRYNMHMTPNSLLLEFGTDVNTLDEALYSAELMGEVLADVLLEYNVAG